MAGNQDFQTQLEALTELEKYLQRLESEMQEMMRLYWNELTVLHSRGLPRQVFEKFLGEYCPESDSHVKQSCAVIEQAIPYVRLRMQLVEQALNG